MGHPKGDLWVCLVDIRIWRPEEKLELKLEILGYHPKSNADKLRDYRMLWRRCQLILAKRVSALSISHWLYNPAPLPEDLLCSIGVP